MKNKSVKLAYRMKHLSKLLIAFFLFALGITIRAQSNIPAAGGNSSGSEGTE